MVYLVFIDIIHNENWVKIGKLVCKIQLLLNIVYFTRNVTPINLMDPEHRNIGF